VNCAVRNVITFPIRSREWGARALSMPYALGSAAPLVAALPSDYRFAVKSRMRTSPASHNDRVFHRLSAETKSQPGRARPFLNKPRILDGLARSAKACRQTSISVSSNPVGWFVRIRGVAPAALDPIQKLSFMATNCVGSVDTRIPWVASRLFYAFRRHSCSPSTSGADGVVYIRTLATADAL
jgi:hypothetical protein